LYGKRSALLASACLLPFALDAQALAQTHAAQAVPHTHGRHHRSAAAAGTTSVAAGGTIQSIKVSGNQRIETSTIVSYLVVQAGEPFNQDELDRSLKTLYATGLFSDVTLSRQGGTLLIHVVENPIVNRIAFEGNHAAKDEDITKEISLRARAVYTPEMATHDRQKILDLYAQKGRYDVSVTPQIIRLSHNRVDVIFQISEGELTLIRKIAFVGNKAFSEARLAQVITSKETAWYRFFSSSDEYNPDRVKYDGELLRRFYLRNGYVDFNVTDATAELSPNHKAFYVTFTLHEGPRYRYGKIEVQSSLRHVTPQSLRPRLNLFEHQWYDGDDVQNESDRLQSWLQANGHPFAQVRPEIARNTDNHTVDLLLDVSEGPRVFVDRIDINGNTITQDRVIRRQFDFAEGDALTPAAQRRAKQSLQDLGFFNTVTVQTQAGSAPDREVVNIGISEKPTGQLTLGGGYSTDAGILGNAGIRQSNLVGSGIDAGITGTLAQYERQVDLSVTDPYFLNRNLVAGIDLYDIETNNQYVQNYYETRLGGTARIGYAFNRYLSQSWNYSLVDRDVGDIYSAASLVVQAEAGHSLLSQIGTTLAYDRRDSRLSPRHGYSVTLGVDVAGIGGDAKYVRMKADTAYYVPLDALTGNHDWTLSFKGGVGYLTDYGGGRESIVDNFYLGGDNLRGFLDGGVGPHTNVTQAHQNSDAVGGRFIYTESQQVTFPLPLSADLGLSGRYFVDVGGLGGERALRKSFPAPNQLEGIYNNSLTPRVSTGVGVSWKSPFGLINVDLGVPIVKKDGDQTQVFRFGFGSNF